MESTNRLKQRLSRLFRPRTLLRASCGSTTSATGSIFTSSSAADTSSRRSLSAATTESAPPSTAFDRSLSFSSSSRFLSLDCASACRPTKASGPIDVVPYVVTFNVADKRNERELARAGDPQAAEEKEEAKRSNRRTSKKEAKPLLSNNAYGFTSSSDSELFSDDGGGGRDEKGAGAFFSSRSFSSDSSAFYGRPSKRKARKKRSKKQSKPPPPRKRTGNNKKGVPVMKRSSDPYIDFRSSMVEMIVERQIFGARDLERLLHSYLALNPPHHHAVILRAFADITQVLYGH